MVTLLHLDLDMFSRDVGDVIWVVHSWLYKALSLSLEDSGLDWLDLISRIARSRRSLSSKVVVIGLPA